MGVSVVRVFETDGGLTYWRLWPISVVILSGGFAMLQAPVLDCASLDFFSVQQDGLAAPEVDIGRVRLSRLS